MRNTRAIKEEAVARIRANDAPLLILAREYGVSTNTLRAWLRESALRARAQEEANRVARALSQEPDLQDGTSASQRERLLMHAMEYSPATIIITDAEGKIVYANPKLAETTGYAVEEVIGQNPRVLKSGETSAGDYRKLWKTILGGEEWRGTFHNRRKDGSLYWERASISPVYDDAGRITHFMAVKEDISDYMGAEQAHRKTAASFLSVIAALPHGLLVVDPLGRILLANAAAESFMGRNLPEGTQVDSLGLRWADADGRPLAVADQPLDQLKSNLDTIKEIRARLGVPQASGDTNWLLATLRPLQLPEPGETAVLLVFE